VACRLDGRPIGYVLGKSEGKGSNWHGHVTAVTVAPSHRKLGIARQLMHHLEHVSEQYQIEHTSADVGSGMAKGRGLEEY
jgi:ribosomal protein S18 acetylase RimI-like enzyme